MDNVLQTFRKEQKKGNDEEPLKKGKKGWALSQKPIPQYQALRWKEGLQGYTPQVQQPQEMPCFLWTVCRQKQVFTINSLEDVKGCGAWTLREILNLPLLSWKKLHYLLHLKLVIILKHCYLMYFQYAKMMRIFQKYTRQTGASGNISPINKKIINIFSAFKHVEADIVGSSSSSGIFNWGNEIILTNLLLFVRSTSGAQCCVPVHACLY